MRRHEYCASHVLSSSISESPPFKPRHVISSGHSSLFQYIMKNIGVAIGTLILNNRSPFGTSESMEMDDIILKAEEVPK